MGEMRRAATAPIAELVGSANQEPPQRHTHQGRPLEMSPRQAEVLKLLAAGHTDKEIGQEIGISPRTVQTHMNNFLRKNLIRTRIEAVAIWACQTCRPR